MHSAGIGCQPRQSSGPYISDIVYTRSVYKRPLYSLGEYTNLYCEKTGWFILGWPIFPMQILHTSLQPLVGKTSRALFSSYITKL